MINRVNENNKLWNPGSKSRVCSNHFEEGFNYPILNLNYPGAEEKIKRMFPDRIASKRRKLENERQAGLLHEDESTTNEDVLITNDIEPDHVEVVTLNEYTRFEVSPTNNNDFEYKYKLLKVRYEELLHINDKLTVENDTLTKEKEEVKTENKILSHKYRKLQTVYKVIRTSLKHKKLT